MTGSLIKLDNATRMLAEIRSVDDAKKVIDLAEAARIYARQVSLGLEAQNHAAEIKLRAQRRAGEILDSMKDTGERQSQGQYQKLQGETFVAPTLAELDINKVDAHRWQTIASVPEEEFDEYIETTKGEGEELTTNKIYRDTRKKARRQERADNIDEISKGNGNLNTEIKYPIIYADPPWQYEHSKTDNRKIENQYPTMSLDEICEMKVGELATPDAVLFMWATSPKLEEALRVISSWGFTYRTNMVWIKDRIGMGYYARQQHELLLIATRGSVPVPEPENRVSSVLHSPRLEHSKKPEQYYETIERMYPEYKKIELFSRNQYDGWESWGNQT